MSLALSACGLKDDLYLPEPNQTSAEEQEHAEDA